MPRIQGNEFHNLVNRIQELEAEYDEDVNIIFYHYDDHCIDLEVNFPDNCKEVITLDRATLIEI